MLTGGAAPAAGGAVLPPLGEGGGAGGVALAPVPYGVPTFTHLLCEGLHSQNDPSAFTKI
jgi:hypothetical protein